MESKVVVIPVYKKMIDTIEEASLRNTLKVLHRHPVVLVSHKDLDLGFYNKVSEEEGVDISVEYFDKKFFSSVEGYNALCYSKEFYERFSSYCYMLICQLDAWVFSDQLDYWCAKGYDYIGAPIFHTYNKTHYTQSIVGIGNGGFSLRRVAHCLRVLSISQNRPFVKPLELIRFYSGLGKYTDDFTQNLFRRIMIVPTVFLKFFGFGNTLGYYIRKHANEDLIFGSWSDKAWGLTSNLPEIDEAMKFSFEVNPSLLFNKVGHLPFGCHAFTKWEYEEFWSKYIKL